MAIKTNQPKKFVVRLAEVGTDTFSAGFKKFQDEDGLRLAYDTVMIMTQNFMIEETLQAKFRYHLACLILSQISGYDEKGLMEDIKNSKNFLGKWKFKKVK